MRRIGLADLDAAARAVLASGQGEAVAVRMLAEADLADRYRKRTGRAHAFGNGTLLAAAFRRPLAPQPAPGDAGYLLALRLVLQAVAGRRSRNDLPP